MHFLTIVALPPARPGLNRNIEDEIAVALDPYDENDYLETVSDEDGTYEWNPQSFWDWYQIGGRWSGHFEDGYDPQTDPRNLTTCSVCHGTGTRSWKALNVSPEWIAEMNGCNGCKGTGISLKWATDWVQGPGNHGNWANLRPAFEADPARMLPSILVIGEQVFRSPWSWQPEQEGVAEVKAEMLNELRRLPDDALLVVVDCHA